MFVKNSIDNFDVLLCKNIYGFRFMTVKMIYKMCDQLLILLMNPGGLDGYEHFIVYNSDFISHLYIYIYIYIMSLYF